MAAAQALTPLSFASHTPPSGIWFLSNSWTRKLEPTEAAVLGDTHSQNSIPPYALASINAGWETLVPENASSRIMPAPSYWDVPVSPAMHMACGPGAPPSSPVPTAPGSPAGSGL